MAVPDDRAASTDGDCSEVPLTDVVVREVAETSETSPLELPPLQSAVDLDALDNLFDPRWTDADPSGHVTFAYAGYEVTVYADDTVTVGPRTKNGGDWQ